ncbi:DGQHR domain-containing protein [Janthinobacterium sp. J1-1]|uniref:DGQHR domain-containing protein n=1 Tax=Janthinobacterium sp. J1-1 TaxID=3065910 RepID=UPI00281114B5|nr:DGQHR domain-containing protein [Janthinobacterium sp. J1-1]
MSKFTEKKEWSISIDALKVSQPIGDFFIAVIPHNELTEICYTDVREFGKEGSLDAYMGIQREIKPDRIEEIKSYVRSPDATFPTSVILAIPNECAEWDPNNKKLIIKEYIDDLDEENNIYRRTIAKILDGQHRVTGLSEGDNFQLPLEDDGAPLKFDINVSIFIGADIAEQANIFATVNLAQTKVNRSLVYDLAELSKSRSPFKTAHNVAVVLDQATRSPFFQNIKRLGVATQGRIGETLTQATIVDSIIPLYSKNPALDVHVLKKGKKLRQPTLQELQQQIFRGLFVNEEDEIITKIIWSYFASIKERWPIAWDNKERGNIIKRTNGIKAFMRFLPTAYIFLAKEKIGRHVEKNEFLTIFKNINILDDDFNINNFPPGSSGESKLYKKLIFEFSLNSKS